jgi:hypothetical protein
VRLLFLFGLLLWQTTFGQIAISERAWVDRLDLSGALPPNLLGTRSAAFYNYRLTPKELSSIQESFQQTGIDAVFYFELDKLTAGKDITRAFTEYLAKREVSNLLFVEKDDAGFRITVTTFKDQEGLIAPEQTAWSVSNRLLTEALKELYRTSSNQQKKENLLINDVPEMDMKINPILGKRNEFYAMDLKVDPLAVPKTGNELIDQRIAEIFEQNYPLKYKITEPGISERDLRRQGLLYVVCYVHARGVVARELLGYDMSKSESAFVSVTYPQDQQEVRNIPANTPVFKFYFKHIDSGNVFLGTKWDADLTWEEALLNQINGMKAELRLE